MRTMKKRSQKAKSKPNLIRNFEALTPYFAKVAKGSMHRHNMFSLCVKASACKCFEFNLSIRDIAKSKSAFFAMPSLRGICEDLIVLRYVSKMPSPDREQLVMAFYSAELGTRVKLQDAFFTAFRPQQPVLRFRDVDTTIASAEAVARSIWNRHGWPNLQKGMMPQIRQLAEKQGMHQLAILYDYLYRLTSAGAHFNVQSLLRSGWGPSPKQFVFSTKNFHEYFARYCALYGAFMLCLYFEFFNSILRPNAKERALVDKIREDVLLASRWPEMVTYEEMNQKPPEGGETLRTIVSALQAVSRRRLVSKSVNYGNKRSAERRLVVNMLKLLSGGKKPPDQK